MVDLVGVGYVPRKLRPPDRFGDVATYARTSTSCVQRSFFRVLDCFLSVQLLRLYILTTCLTLSTLSLVLQSIKVLLN